MRTHPAALGALLVTLSACQAVPPGGPFSFSLDPAGGDSPVAIAASPAPAALGLPASPAPTDMAPAAGGSGGASGHAAKTTGVVLDALGRPLEGVKVAGAGASVVTDAGGAFSISASGPLTASRAGYTSQTLGAPYGFRLSPLAHEPGVAYTLSGVTAPPAAGARVLFVDAAGTTAATVTDAGGRFDLEVSPRAAADTPGLVAVVSGLALPVAPRFGVLQAVTPRAGALRLAHPASGAVTIPVADATGSWTLAPAPAPDATRETSVQFVDETGLSVPIGSAEGDFPASLPTFSVAGLHLVATLTSSGPSGGASVERADPAPGETWRPTWLARPRATVVGDRLQVEADGPVALSLTPESLAAPVWQAIAAPGSVALPARGPGGYVLSVSAFAEAPGSVAGAFGGATRDRSSATTRLALPAAE